MNSSLKKSKKSYERVYWSVLTEFNLTPSEFVLLFLIRGLSKKPGASYASKKFLAERLNLTPVTIFTLINKLVEKGLMEKTGKTDLGTGALTTTDKFDSYINSLKYPDDLL